jgi:hypothetical protein
MSEVALDYFQVRSAQEQIAIAQTNLESEMHTAEVTRLRKAPPASSARWTRPMPTRKWRRPPRPSPRWKLTIQQNIFALSILLDRPPADLLEDLSKPGARPAHPAGSARRVAVGPVAAAAGHPRGGGESACRGGAHRRGGGRLLSAILVDRQSVNYQNSLARDLFAGGSGILFRRPAGELADFFRRQHRSPSCGLQKAATDAAYITYQKTVLAALSDVESYLGGLCQGVGPSQGLSDGRGEKPPRAGIIAATLPGRHGGISDRAGRGTLPPGLRNGAGAEPPGHLLGPGQHLPRAGRRVGMRLRIGAGHPLWLRLLWRPHGQACV